MIARLRDSRGRFTSNKSNGQSLLAVEELVGNAMLSRSELFRQFLDPRRDIDAEAGYPQTSSLTAKAFRSLYDRDPVAARVNDVLPDESWMATPKVFESERPDETTEFEKSWKELLRGTSKFQGEEGNPIWENLQRADRLSGIGRFGILLIGLSDGKDLRSEPFSNDGNKITFLRSFGETTVDIVSFDEDVKSPRFGQPTMYSIELGEPSSQTQGTVASLKSKIVKVHWKRVSHLADNLGSGEIFGIPRMQQVFNRLLDLQKLYAGSAEMYWRGAFPGLSIETNPRMGTNVRIDKSDMRDMMEQYMNGLQRYITLTGMSAKSLAPQVVDPTPQIEVQIEAVCIKLGIPKRIFKGSERGELASTQDDATFNDRLRSRQNGYITPRIIVPFIDRLIDLKVLPEPESYGVVWPDLDALTDDERAQVAERRSRAMMNYVTGQVEEIMAPIDLLTRELNFTQGDAEAILKKVEADMKRREGVDMKLKEEEDSPEEFERAEERLIPGFAGKGDGQAR